MQKYNLATVLAGALLLVACDGGQSGDQPATLSESEITLPLPERIRSITALNPNNITATAIVNGVQVTLQRNSSGGGFRGDIQVPMQTTFPVELEFSEQFSNEKLVLASSSQQVTTGTSNQQLNLRRSSYDFGSHDSDGDSVSNIVEREENTNPLDSAQAPDMINVNVLARRPEALRNSNFRSYNVEASVGSDVKVLSASGADFSGNFYVVDRAPVAASVELIETFTGQQLSVATQTRQFDSISDQQMLIFETNDYSTPDRDSDGQSDLAELVAGTDLNTANNPDPTTTTSTVTTRFSVPEIVENARSVYVEYRIDNTLARVVRTANSFAGTTNAVVGSTMVVDVAFMDTFNGNVYTVATARKNVLINGTAQTVSFADSDFELDYDVDNDGIANYQERNDGTDPFNPPEEAPDPVSCTVSPLPVSSGLPEDWVTIENVSGYIDCDGASYAVSATGFSFTWSSVADNIGWLVPADGVGGDSFEYQIEVRNPSNGEEVYATATVSTEVEESECTETSREIQVETDADLFVQNGRIFNNDELRVNTANRRALIGFEVPAQDGQLTAAALVVVVGDDSGSGVIGVYQDDTFQWSETDSSLTFPALTNLVGSRDGAWQSDSTYSIGLDALFVSGSQVNLFLRQDSGGNDVAFTSRETGSPSVLVLEYTSCI